MQLIFIGKTILGYEEKGVWRMTLRRLNELFKRYCKFNGIQILSTQTIDDIIPEEV